MRSSTRIFQLAGLLAACALLSIVPAAHAIKSPAVDAAAVPPAVLGNAPLPGAAGAAARRAEESQVQFLSPTHLILTAKDAAQVKLHFRIADGLHINSHSPHDKTLIPTSLITKAGKGVEVVSVRFPPGEAYSPAFAPNTKMSVYSGNFVVRLVIRAPERGSHILQSALRYQACDFNACRPPQTLPIAIAVQAK